MISPPDILHSLYDVRGMIEWGGLFLICAIIFTETGLFFGFFLPGDSLLVTAGLLAAVDGTLDIRFLNLLLCTAAVLGDNAGYAIGYHVGPRIFNRENSFFLHKNHVVRAQKFYEKYGPKTIVLARFVPIVRTFAPTVAGVGKMDYKKFITYNVFGGIGWVLSMTLTGYFLGRSIPNIEKKVHWVALAVIFLSLIPIAREWWIAKKEKEGKA